MEWVFQKSKQFKKYRGICSIKDVLKMAYKAWTWRKHSGKEGKLKVN